MKVDFKRLTWENYPSTETPINADNLNRLEEGVAGLYSDMRDIEEELDGGVGEYVTDWLTEHVNPVGSAVVVDDTLTIAGAAADAKKTGDEISGLKEDLNNTSVGVASLGMLDLIHSVTKKDNTRLTMGGQDWAENGYFATDYISVENRKYVLQNFVLGNTVRVCFYSENKTFSRMINEQNKAEFEPTNSEKYIRVCDFSANYDTDAIYAKKNIINQSYDSLEYLTLNYSRYGMYGNGEASSTELNTRLLTQKFLADGLYIVTFPDVFKAKYNVKNYVKGSVTTRINVETTHPFSMFFDGLFRVQFERKDGGEININGSDVSEIKIIRINPSRNGFAKIKIAANDSLDFKKEQSHIVLDGNNDTDILAALFGCYHSINVFLYGGTYQISKFWTYTNTAKIALACNDSNYDEGGNSETGGTAYRRYITLSGESNCTPQAEESAKFVISKSLHESITEGINYFILGTPYSYGATVIRMATSFDLRNFSIIGYDCDKPITYVDLSRALSSMVDGVNVRSSQILSIYTYESLKTTPHKECCGIRVGRGSNYGIQNCIKHSNYWYCGKGIACNGEHFIFEDVKAHHCVIGFVFGDRQTVGRFEHPNVLIGCSIESCYQLMELSKNGETTEQPFVYDASLNHCYSTLIVIGLSTETTWTVPTEEEGGGTTQTTLPCKEILKGAYRGRFECDYVERPFESESGDNISCVWYNGANTYATDVRHVFS